MSSDYTRGLEMQSQVFDGPDDDDEHEPDDSGEGPIAEEPCPD
jgi:hypothetical protein